MTEQAIRGFLQALRRVIRQVGLYPIDHPITIDALVSAEAATREMSPGTGSVVMSLRDGLLYVDRNLLPQVSLEYDAAIRLMEQRGIESITVLTPVSTGDLFELATFIAGRSDDLPAEGTIRINEAPPIDPDDGTPLSRLQRSYGGNLHAVRSASLAMARDGVVELQAVMHAVGDLADASLGHAGAALLLSTVKSHDEYTYYHSVNTCILSLAMGRMLGLERDELIPIGAGAVLHDIGKVAVSPETLQYPGRLSPEQWAEVRIHPLEGAHAIMAAGGPGHEIAATIALEHHARYDGRGYPNLNRQRRPQLASRLVAVADAYDAMTSRRSYRRAETPGRALQILLHGAGTSYDPDIVRVFIRMMGLYPPGSVLLLDSGEVIVVTHPASADMGELRGVLAVSASGERIEPEPMAVSVTRVEAQLLPEQVDVDTAALLEDTGVVDLMLLPDAPPADGEHGIDERLLREEALKELAALLA